MRLASLLAVAALSFDVCDATLNEVFSSKHLYDWGWYGLYPTVGYHSSKVRPPHVNFLSWDERCTNGYYFIGPKGRLVDNEGPVIIDGRGNLVWSGEEIGQASDFQVQTYKGKQYLTYWKNIEGLSMGWGRGIHYMMDENYEVFKEIHPVGEGIMGDIHEFHITSDDTALMTAYMPRTWDLSSIGGPQEGWIMDSLFQELDIETGELLFEWRASDHVPIEDTIRYFAGKDTGDTPERGFDYFHINSMDKDEDGNYLISGRHTHTIHSVSPKGEMLWTLGGKNSQFTDLSDGAASDFAYQHHIRYHNNGLITMFDNAKSERSGPSLPVDYSRGLIIQLDQDNMTAELVNDIHDPSQPKHSASQGSAQLWDNGRSMIVNFGWFPALTEFDTETNEVLCDIHVCPSMLFPLGFVGSYRGFKGQWSGKPHRRPAAVLDAGAGKFYVSWNGATEVDKWVLQGVDWDAVEDDKWVDIVSKDREGQFETEFDIDSSMPAFVRAKALASNGTVLTHSWMINRALGNMPPREPVDMIFEWLTFLLKWGIIFGALYAWDLCRPFRASIWRIAGKAFLVAKPMLRRLSNTFCCCLPRGRYLPLWMRGRKYKGPQHELQPLYSSDDEEKDVSI